jgi:26S proteasome regulatory subunit N2
MFSIALAYACTSNNKAIQRLLHVAVSDVDDDVRRSAVMAIGFVLANQPAQVPRVLSLLSESWNPHVRYGACMAVGIACAGGTGPWRKDALALLEPLLKDSTDFVRQGAFIGMAMVLMQHNETSEPKLAVFRKAIADCMASKTDTMTKIGALLGAGIVDAGGRNVTISLMSPAGHKKMAAIVGMAMFPQFWFWYPLVHFLSLSFSATAVIGLNRSLAIPEPFSFVSNAPPASFAYPPNVELKKAEEKKAVKHATLSVTAKAKAKAKRKEGASAAGDAMEQRRRLLMKLRPRSVRRLKRRRCTILPA